MVFPKHALLQFGGTLGGGLVKSESWSCSLRLLTTRDRFIGGGPIDLNRGEQQEYLDDVAVPALTAFWAAQDTNNIGSQAIMKFIKFNAIGPDGKYIHDTTTVEDVNVIPGGTQGASKYPFQVSKVLTLDTSVARGRAKRGRIYIPTPTNFVDQDGYASIGQPELNAWAELFDTLNQSEGGVSRPFYCTVAVVSGLNPAPGTGRPVTSVSMDNVLDTQRRRVKSLSPIRIESPVDFE